MGSFAARYYTELYGNEISGAIYCGTSGENPAAGIAVGLASFVAKRRGSRYRSELSTASPLAAIIKMRFAAHGFRLADKRGGDR